MNSPESSAPIDNPSSTEAEASDADQLALFDATVDSDGTVTYSYEDEDDEFESDEQIAERLKNGIIETHYGEIESEPARVIKQQAGRAAAATARKNGRMQISDNKISRFIDRIGINSDEQRAKDGTLAKKFRARRAARKARSRANRESLIAPAPVAELEESQENKQIAAGVADRISDMVAENMAKKQAEASKKQPKAAVPSRPLFGGSAVSNDDKDKKSKNTGSSFVWRPVPEPAKK